jgi:uncharacterized protein
VTEQQQSTPAWDKTLVVTPCQLRLLRRLLDAPLRTADVREFFRKTRLILVDNGMIVVVSEDPTWRAMLTDRGARAIEQSKRRPPRGFQTLSPERLREIASQGGKVAHATGRAFKFKSGDPIAVAAGRKGVASRRARLGLGR